MANYNATIRTNYFRVTDEEKYQHLFSGLSGEDDVHDFSKTDENGTVWHAFGCMGSIYWFDPDKNTEDDFCIFLEEIQEILPEDDAMIILESGYEKLRYVTGLYTVVTSKEIRYGEINDLALKEARNMLANENYSTQTDY